MAVAAGDCRTIERRQTRSAPLTVGGSQRTPRRAADAARRRAGNLASRVEAARPRHATIDISYRAVERDRRIAAGVLAGGIAYRLFLWSIPFALVVAGGLGIAGAQNSKSAAESLGLTGAMVTSLGDAAKAAKGYWWMLGVGIYLMIVTGVSALRALELVHGAAWSVPARKTAGYIASGVGFSLLFGGLIVANTAIVYARKTAELDRSLYLVVGLLAGGLWWVVSRRLPPGDKPWMALLPGAALVAAGAAVVEVVSFYVVGPYLDHKSQIYGAIGIASMLLLWLYVVGRLMVGSAIVNAARWEQSNQQHRPEPDPVRDIEGHGIE